MNHPERIAELERKVASLLEIAENIHKMVNALHERDNLINEKVNNVVRAFVDLKEEVNELKTGKGVQ